MNLSVKIFISLILSVIVGLILGEENLPWLKAYLAPFGTMFINLIKMIIVPVVLASLVCGVASLGDTKKLGRIGIKVVLLYLVTNNCCCSYHCPWFSFCFTTWFRYGFSS